MSMKLSRKKINEMVDRDYSYSGRRGGGSGAAGGGGVSEGWVDDNYVSKLFWSNIFVIHKKVTTVVMNGETEISRTVDTTGVFTPNEQPSVKSTTDQQTGYVTTVKTEVDSIEAKKGFWTNYYVSALGQGSGGGGGGGGGGSSTLQGLLDVNIPATMTQENNGQVLMYNYQQNRWINANLPASGVTSIGLSMPTGFSVDPATISSSGTFQVTFASGYSLPKTDNVNKGVTAYGWGNHATAGYVKANDVYSKTDADNKFLTIAAFERLFNALNSSNQKVNHPYSSGVASIKALFGLWTEQYVSALGQGSGGGGGGGGATLFEPLDSINNAGLGLPTGSKFLLYNGSAWVYANSPLGDISTLQGYFTNGAANTAVKLKTARNLWKQPFDGSEDVRGDLCLVPTAGSTTSDSAKLLFQTHTSASEYTYGPYIQAINVANYGRKRLAIFQKNDTDWTTAQTEVFSILPTGNVGIGTISPAEKLTVNGNISTATADGTYIQIGGARIVWDYDHNALKVVKSDGTSAANFYATGGVSALGQGDGGGGSSETLADLLDVEFVGDPTNGQVLKYNESTHKWYNGTDQAGTVTSVNLSMPTGFQVSGGPITSSGTLSVSFGGSVSANRVLASPNGSAGAPSWRKLVAADIPNLAASKITSGTLDAERLPDLSGTYAATGRVSTLEGYFTNGSATTAVALKTARTIWGQSFDGSADVTGNLTVGNGHIYLNNAKYIYSKDSNGDDRTILYLYSNNVLRLGYGTSGAGYDTYIYGNNVRLLYSSSRSTGFLLNDSGQVSIGSTSSTFITERLNVNGNIRTAAADGSYIQIGGARLVWDYDNNALFVVKNDGTTAANFYATGAVSALGLGDSGGGGATTLAELADVDLTNLAGGNLLKYNGSTNKWYNTALTADDIPELSAAKITSGTFAAARIPNLAASKITSGTFATARIPDLSATYATTGRVSTLEGYFTNGVANNSAQLGGLEKTAFPILSVTGCAKIESGTNLNQVTDFGTYYSPSAANSATLINTPHTTSNFKLVNMWCGGSSYGLQFVFAYNKGQIYVRGKNSTTWSDWRTVAFLESTIAKATALETARTIWGQSFDGSANVSGDMTGVGSITMTGNLLMNNTHSVQIKNASSTYLRVLTVDANSNFVIGETVDLNQHNTYLRGRSFTFQSIANGGTAADRTTLMQLTNSGRLYLPLANQGIRIGDGVIVWDSTNNALKVVKYDNSAANFYATGGVSALGQGSSGGGGGGSSTLAELNDVEFSGTLEGGQVLTYDNNSNKWYNAYPSWYNLTDTPNTIASYNIQDCYIYNGIIRIGNDEIEPITSLAGYATELWVQDQGYLTTESYRGTVASVNLSMPTGFQVSGGPITSSGTLSVSFGGSVSANRVLAAPSSSNGTPSWRKLVAADIPDLSGTYATTGRVSTLEGYFTNGVADVAAKLNTARTLWGQSFDGTANVSGDMSSVSSITMSGNLLMDNTHSVQIKNASSTYLRVLTVDSGSNFVIGETVDVNHHNTYLRGQNFTFQSIPASGTTADRTTLMQLNASGRLYLPKGDQGIRIGDGVIIWDSTNNALKIQKYDGTEANLYATGGISALEQT